MMDPTIEGEGEEVTKKVMFWRVAIDITTNFIESISLNKSLSSPLFMLSLASFQLQGTLVVPLARYYNKKLFIT